MLVNELYEIVDLVKQAQGLKDTLDNGFKDSKLTFWKATEEPGTISIPADVAEEHIQAELEELIDKIQDKIDDLNVESYFVSKKEPEPKKLSQRTDEPKVREAVLEDEEVELTEEEGE